MSKPHGIIVFGANGSGKTTLGRELAQLLGFAHLDIEGYSFYPSEIPYSQPRPFAETVALLQADIEKASLFRCLGSHRGFWRPDRVDL